MMLQWRTSSAAPSRRRGTVSLVPSLLVGWSVLWSLGMDKAAADDAPAESEMNAEINAVNFRCFHCRVADYEGSPPCLSSDAAFLHNSSATGEDYVEKETCTTRDDTNLFTPVAIGFQCVTYVTTPDENKPVFTGRPFFVRTCQVVRQGNLHRLNTGRWLPSPGFALGGNQIMFACATPFCNVHRLEEKQLSGMTSTAADQLRDMMEKRDSVEHKPTKPPVTKKNLKTKPSTKATKAVTTAALIKDQKGQGHGGEEVDSAGQNSISFSTVLLGMVILWIVRLTKTA